MGIYLCLVCHRTLPVRLMSSLIKSCHCIGDAATFLNLPGPSGRHIQLSNAVRDKCNKGSIDKAGGRVIGNEQGVEKSLEDSTSALQGEKEVWLLGPSDISSCRKNLL